MENIITSTIDFPFSLTQKYSTLSYFVERRLAITQILDFHNLFNSSQYLNMNREDSFGA